VVEDLRTGDCPITSAHRISEVLKYARTMRNLLMLLPRLCKNIMLQSWVTKELSYMDFMQGQRGNELKMKKCGKARLV